MCGRAHFLIERRKRQTAPLSQLDICCIVKCKAEAFGKTKRCRPCVNIGFGINGDGHGQKPGQCIVAKDISDAIAPNGHLQCVADFKAPYRRHEGVALDDLVQHFLGSWRGLVVEAPCHSDRCIDDLAHNRPSLISSLIFNPPSVTPLRISRRPRAALWARSRSMPDASGGTSLATILPPGDYDLFAGFYQIDAETGAVAYSVPAAGRGTG